jgi:hypothetical protein
LREAGSGATAAESTFASRAKNWSLAFMVILLEAWLARGSQGVNFTLPSRRHYPDQVPRVCSHPAADRAHFGGQDP